MLGAKVYLLAFTPTIFGQAYIQQKLGVANGEPAGTLFRGVGMTQSFDYVIIRGDTAGSVVTSRLAEDPDISIAGMVTELSGKAFIKLIYYPSH